LFGLISTRNLFMINVLIFGLKLSNQICFFTSSGSDSFLTIVIPGRCSRIVKYKLPPIDTNLDGGVTVGLITNDKLPNNCKITSSVFDVPTGLLYATCKNYNSVGSRILLVNTSKPVLNIDSSVVTNSPNETNLIMALDSTSLYVATSGFNQIFKYTKDLKTPTIAVLPTPLMHVSSMSVIEKYLYITTSQPNAQFGRISINNFCTSYCSDYGYCDGTKHACACVTGYAKDPLAQDNQYICLPTHIVEYQNTIISERGTAAAFGVLFALSIIAAVAGWFMWFRRQNQSGSTNL